MKKAFLLTTGLLLLFATEILRVYFIMPFPGSQQQDSIQLAYDLDKYIWILRLLGLLLIAYPVYAIFTYSRKWKKAGLALLLLLYGGIFFLFNFRFLAEKMFYQPKNKILAAAGNNTIEDDKLVIGITLNGESKAYPIEIIGYHHQVQDTLGGTPIMVTYCTVCRTGRVYSPVVNGFVEKFRLVGMDHFNAMFEDATTHSWWQQATGKAIVGPLTGMSLAEWPSEQMRLGAWVRKYPSTLILQPDTLFKENYKDLAGFDMGTIKGHLEKRDSASWKMKSWVIGVRANNFTRAYDWNELVNHRIINDTIHAIPLVIVLEKDSASFHVWQRQVEGRELEFDLDPSWSGIRDKQTGSVWNMDGRCIEGPLYGHVLGKLPAYQEFWHSWKQFHPATQVR